MIIENQFDITPAVLAELERAQDPRFREIMGAAVRHLHAFVREVKLTEPEFQMACATIAKLGHSTTPSHNEVVLAAGSLGISSLVCLLNNGDHGQTETTANLLGPFWREGVDVMPNGASIVRSTTPGVPLFVNAWVKDRDGKPVDGAVVDVWQSSSEGFYENQDPAQADMNLRGKFITDAAGHVSFRSIKPAGYPIPERSCRRPAARPRAPQLPASAHPLYGGQARLQNTVFTGLFKRRPQLGHRCSVRRDQKTGRPICAACKRDRPEWRRVRPLVLLGLHLHHRGWTIQASARAHHRQSKWAASDPRNPQTHLSYFTAESTAGV